LSAKFERNDTDTPSLCNLIVVLSRRDAQILEAVMGLMDVLNGMQNGPHGPKPGTSGGMSPVTMAVIGLLAYKAFKQFTAGTNASPASAGTAPSVPHAQPANTGGLGGLLTSGLGGLLAGGAAGSVLSGGLGDLLKQFQQAGQGGAANSWVGHGPNQPISPSDLERVLDSDQISTLIAHTGLSRDQVLHALSQYLPGMVDGLTPSGRLPTEDEVSRIVQ
jgi:uncharacterized protein YidB (DUF937 family)